MGDGLVKGGANVCAVVEDGGEDFIREEAPIGPVLVRDEDRVH